MRGAGALPFNKWRGPSFNEGRGDESTSSLLMGVGGGIEMVGVSAFLDS